MKDVSKTLAELVSSEVSSARVLESFGLDFCCHGDETLDRACARTGIDPEAVLAALATGRPSTDDHDCAGMSPAQLVAHLVTVHHTYLHAELGELERLAAKVVDVHGVRHPELEQVHGLVQAVGEDLLPHLYKEERVLFPAILTLLEGRAQFPFGSIRNPIAMMAIEHERAGELLAELRNITGGYQPAEGACVSWRLLYERLATLEHDTHLHVFEENSLLFPRVVELEEAAS